MTAQSDHELAAALAKVRTPPGYAWAALAREIEAVLARYRHLPRTAGLVLDAAAPQAPPPEPEPFFGAFPDRGRNAKLKQELIAAPGECAYCDRRRAYNAAAMRRTRNTGRPPGKRGRPRKIRLTPPAEPGSE